MPPLPTIANIVRVTLNWTQGSLNAATVWHFESAAYNLGALFTALNSNLDANMFDCTGQAATIDTVDFLPLDGSSGTTTISPTPGDPWRGGSATADFIPAACGLVKLQTGLAGPRHRGRTFVPWVLEGHQDAGLLSTGTTGPMQTAWDGFLGGMNGDSCPMQVTSYKWADSHDVLAAVVERPMATQRRRQNQLR